MPAISCVYCGGSHATAADVRDVIVDGRVLVRRGALTELSGLDRAEVVARGAEQARRLRA